MVAHADKPVLSVGSPDEWENWLQHSGDPGGVRLYVRKKGSVKPGISYVEAVEIALCYGWIDGQGQSADDDYYLQAFTPRRAR
ncbi:MAG: bacteriocin-protection protein, YdeI/OmpD-associated family, partial [Ilumatobacteraceae bacterium]